jgi:single-strand DNA-binding protein
MNGIRNNVMLIGNLGKDPELKQLPSGSWVANLSLATNETYKNQKGEKVTSTQWHRLVAWGKTAEMMNDLLKKGKEVAVKGKLTYRDYEDKDGIKRYISEILVSEFMLLS